jgi:hypothetical protein
MADRVFGMVAVLALVAVSMMWLANFAALGH